jgi:hypothetical protein
MRTTRNNISKEIKRRTGLDIGLEGDANVGCYHFVSDDYETQMMLAGFYETTVYTAQIGGWSVERWADEFDAMLEEYEANQAFKTTWKPGQVLKLG